MKIVLSGSITFLEKINEIKEELEKLGHEVKAPEKAFKLKNGETVTEKEYLNLMKDFFAHKIKWSDVMLVINPEKNNIKGYIGANTFLEMGGAFYLGKKIYVLNNIEQENFKDEIEGMGIKIINNDLELIGKK